MQKNQLFEPYRLQSKIELDNRIVMAPMTTWAGEANGELSKQEEEYYKARSKAAGMIVSAACAIDHNAQAFVGQISARSDDFLPSLTRLAKAIKQDGAKAILQIHHGGRMCPEGIHPKAEVVSASDIPAMREGAALPRALSKEEIETLIHVHVEVTERAFQAGFDGVELHGANTYLLQQFVSAHSNRREDKWGGNLEKRMRFPLEIIKELEQRILTFNKPFILGYRFSPEEVETPGLSLSDTCIFVDMLCDTQLDYLHISLSHYKASSLRNTDDPTPVAQTILKAINGRKPLIGVGKITTQKEALDALELGYDLLAVGSSIIANPDWLDRIQNGDDMATELTEKQCEAKKVPKAMFEMLYKLQQMRGNWPGIKLSR